MAKITGKPGKPAASKPATPKATTPAKPKIPKAKSSGKLKIPKADSSRGAPPTRDRAQANPRAAVEKSTGHRSEPTAAKEGERASPSANKSSALSTYLGQLGGKKKSGLGERPVDQLQDAAKAALVGIAATPSKELEASLVALETETGAKKEVVLADDAARVGPKWTHRTGDAETTVDVGAERHVGARGKVGLAGAELEGHAGAKGGATISRKDDLVKTDLGTLRSDLSGGVTARGGADGKLKVGPGGATLAAKGGAEVDARARGRLEADTVLGKVEGEVDVGAKAKVDADVDVSVTGEGLRGATKVGARGEVGAEARAKADTVLGRAEGRVAAKAEAYAEADGDLEVDATGLQAQVHGGIGARAYVEAEGELATPGIELGGERIDVNGKVTGRAEVGAWAEGTVRADATLVPPRAIVDAGGEAFAGVKANATAELGLGDMVKVSGTAGVWAGAGAEGKARLGYDDGKLRIGLKGGAAVGYGAGVGGTVEVDVKKIANAAIGGGIQVSTAAIRYALDPSEIGRDLADVKGKLEELARGLEKAPGQLAGAAQTLIGKLDPRELGKMMDTAKSGVAKGELAKGESVSGIEAALAAAGLGPADATDAGYFLLQHGRVDDAARAFLLGLRHDPRDAKAVRGLATVAFALEDVEAAEALVEQALARAPKDAGSFVLKGMIAEVREAPAEAAEAYRRAAALAPEHGAASLNLGRLHGQRGETAPAIERLDQAARLQPSSAEPHLAAAIVLREAGRLGEAIDHLTRATTADPGHLDAHATLADLRVEAGQLAAARRGLGEAARRLGSPELFDKLAAVEIREGRFGAARDALRAAADLAPEDPGIQKRLAVVSLTARDGANVARAIDRAVALDPNDGEARWLRAGLYELAGRFDLARNELEAAVRLEPRDHRAQSDLGRLVLEGARTPADLERAAEILRRARQLAPESDGGPSYNLALAELRRGARPVAQTLLVEAAARGVSEAGVLLARLGARG